MEVGLVKKRYLLLLGMCVAPVFAQDFASLTVTVVDTTDAVIPDATVTALNTHRGTIYHDVTKSQGFVAFDTLLPGEYSIEVEKGGFRKYRVESLTLTVRARENLRVELHIAEANATTVEVTDRAEVMSSDAAQGISLDHDYLDHLPVNGRNAESLVLMTPGITSAAGGKGDGGFNTNGLRSNTNYYTLDGVSMNRSLGGGGGGFGGGDGRGPRGGGSDGAPGGGGAAAGGSANETISMDAMQEVRIQTSSLRRNLGDRPARRYR